jgi:hypothetical protein
MAKGLLDLLAHTSGLHTAGMRRRSIRAIPAVQVHSSSKSAQAILRQLRICALGGPATAILRFSDVVGGVAH